MLCCPEWTSLIVEVSLNSSHPSSLMADQSDIIPARLSGATELLVSSTLQAAA